MKIFRLNFGRRILFLIFSCLTNCPCVYALLSNRINKAKIDTVLSYKPENNGISVVNGKRWNNRPLYCDDRKAIIFAGEQPGLYGQMGRVMVAISDGKKDIFLHQFNYRKMFYRSGMVIWSLSDPRFNNIKFTFSVAVLPRATGFVSRLTAPKNKLKYASIWCFAPNPLPSKKKYNISFENSGFRMFSDTNRYSDIGVRFSGKVQKWQLTPITAIEPTPNFDTNLLGAYTESKESSNSGYQLTLEHLVPFTNCFSLGNALVARIPFKNNSSQYMAIKLVVGVITAPL